jgi:hypothetical protein
MLCGVVAPQVSDAKYDSWYARAKDALLSAFVVRCAEFARRPGPPRHESVVRDDEQKQIWQAWLARLHHLRPDGDLVGELKALAAKIARRWPTQDMRAASVSPYKGSTFAHDKGTRRRAAAAASSNVERVLSHQEQAKRRRAINMPREPGSSKFACTRGTAAAGMLRSLGGGGPRARGGRLRHGAACAQPVPAGQCRRHGGGTARRVRAPRRGGCGRATEESAARRRRGGGGARGGGRPGGGGARVSGGRGGGHRVPLNPSHLVWWLVMTLYTINLVFFLFYTLCHVIFRRPIVKPRRQKRRRGKCSTTRRRRTRRWWWTWFLPDARASSRLQYCFI